MSQIAQNYWIILAPLVFLIGILIIPKLRKLYFTARITKISAAKNQTVVVLNGKIKHLNKTIIAPLSQKPSIGYLYFVYDRYTTSTLVVSKKEECTDFLLEDKGAACIIKPASAGNFLNSTEWPPTILFSDYLNLDDARKVNDLTDKTAVIRGKRYRHVEYRRQENESVYVKGLFRTSFDDNEKYNQYARGMISSKDKKILITPAYSGTPFVSSSFSIYGLVSAYIKSIFS